MDFVCLFVASVPYQQVKSTRRETLAFFLCVRVACCPDCRRCLWGEQRRKTALVCDLQVDSGVCLHHQTEAVRPGHQ